MTFDAIGIAGTGLTVHRKWLDAISDNIANINTPNYHAKRVQFEEALAASIDAGDGRVGATVRTSLEPTRLDGNRVFLKKCQCF